MAKPKSQTAGDRAVEIIDKLTHTKGPFANQSFNLRPWQAKIIKQLFKTRPDGLRQYRTCLLMLPRKNGKTEIAAALAIYFLLFDGEIGAEIYSAAADKDQAGLVFNVAAQMIRNDPELLAVCEIIDSQKRIVHRRSGSFYRAISAEAYSKHGFNASVVIYDELHAAPDERLYDVLRTSQSARAQPMFIAISTAGYDRNSILHKVYEHAKRVANDPTSDPTFLPLIFEAPKDADWTDERVWKGCNPALGDFRSLEEMRIECARAQQLPEWENTFRRLYLNQWTEQAERWMPMVHWNACKQPIDWKTYQKRTCYVGMDLSSTTDMTALVALFPDEDGTFAVLPCPFIPAENLRARSNRDNRRYDMWIADGYLTATRGPTVDYEAVRAKLHEWRDLYNIKCVSYDPWNATDLVNRLEHVDGFICLKVRQGVASLSAPTKFLTRAILEKKLKHDGHPVLADHIGNAVIEKDSNDNWKPVKNQGATTERMDLLAAMVCATDAMSREVPIPDKQYQLVVLGR